MSDMNLYIDCVGFTTLKLTESAGGVCKFTGKFQEANQVNKNKRMYPFDVLASNVCNLEETIKGRGLFGELDHPCLTDDNFRVLTPNGWMQFSEIREGDFVWSRVNGRMVKSKVNEVINRPYDGTAYKVKGRSINCTFTPGHKFLLCKRQDYSPSNEEVYSTIKDIHQEREKYSHHVIPKTAEWRGSDTDIVIKGVNRKNYTEDLRFEAEKFAGFLGIYLAEGNLKTRNRIEITQVNEEGRKLLREVLPQIHPNIKWKEIPKGFYAVDGRLYDYLIPLGNKYNKYIPTEVKNLSSKCLEQLVYWFAVGDGRMLVEGKSCKRSLPITAQDLGKYSRFDVFTVSKKLIEDLHECVVKMGKAGSRETIVSADDYIFADHVIEAKNKKPLYQLHVSRSKFVHLDPRFLRITEVHHTGRIYCLSTTHGNFYMEKDGKSFWTGNSDSIVHLTNASHLVTKLWWDGDVLMGEGEVLNTPSGKVLKSLIESGVRVGISSRGVGNGQVNNEGVLVIGESYKLITFDAVADPSTFSAFQQKVVGKRETYAPAPVQVESKKKVDGKLIASYFGELLKSRIDEANFSQK